LRQTWIRTVQGIINRGAGRSYERELKAGGDASAFTINANTGAVTLTVGAQLVIELAHRLVVSDHGNLEDLRLRNHTLARVPLLVFGPASRSALPSRIDGVYDALWAASRA
jgi:hypothetical protein